MPVSPPQAQPPLVHLSTDFIRAKEYLEAIVSSSGDAICTTDVHGRIIYFSPGAESLFGLSPDETIGRPVHILYAGGRMEAERVMRALRKDGALRNYETVALARDGRRVHVSLSASLLRDREGRVIGTLGISKDITARVQLESRLKELSITDNLTGLYNQRHFRERLRQEIARARRQGQRLSLVLIDLDGFKAVNDEKGHLEGDRLLKNFAQVLLKGLRREVDEAFRYGGDEFVILLPGQAETKARLVAARLSKAAAAQGVRFSWGAAALAKTGGAAELMRLADSRMFALKKLAKKRRRA